MFPQNSKAVWSSACNSFPCRLMHLLMPFNILFWLPAHSLLAVSPYLPLRPLPIWALAPSHMHLSQRHRWNSTHSFSVADLVHMITLFLDRWRECERGRGSYYCPCRLYRTVCGSGALGSQTSTEQSESSSEDMKHAIRTLCCTWDGYHGWMGTKKAL